jgi:hypothetical protein
LKNDENSLSLFVEAVTVDYGSAEILLCDIVDHITMLRDEQQFKSIYEESVAFCRQNNISVENVVRVRGERIQKVPARFRDFASLTLLYAIETRIQAKHLIESIFIIHLSMLSLFEIRDRFARNKMGDGRLSGMAILVIDREIMIELDQTVEQFLKKHINSRILLL